MTADAYKISPSDFAYLYKDCKRCYYLKLKHNINRPSGMMPGVFSALSGRLQRTLINKDLHTLSNNLPQGVVESQEGYITSQIIEKTKIYINGKYDLLVKQPDGSYLIVDFKISEPREEKAELYQNQLLAYQYAFTNPMYGKPKQITKLGLIIMYPDQIKFEDGQAVLSFPPKWLEVPCNKEAQRNFISFMEQINSLLNGPLPSPNPNCKYCKYRETTIPQDFTV